MRDDLRRGILFKSAGLACLLLAWWAFRHRPSSGPVADRDSRGRAVLFTGKEPLRKVSLTFVSESKGSAEFEDRDIYRTATLVPQAKQVVVDLMEGPRKPGLARLFPPGSDLRELFVGKDGLCVVDLAPETAAALPGGTTAEYLALYSVVRSLTANFPEITAVQFLVGGQRQPTLSGHFDISGPLTKADF